MENIMNNEKLGTYRDIILRNSHCYFKTKSDVLYIGVGTFISPFFCGTSTDERDYLSNLCRDCYFKLHHKLSSHPEMVTTRDGECGYIPAEIFFDIATTETKHSLCSDFWDVVDELKKVAEIKEVSDGVVE